MKTTNTTSKTGFLPRHFTALLAAFTIASSPYYLCAAEAVPFRGNAEGAIVSASADSGGVLVTVIADGHATHLGKFSREELLLLDPVAGTIAGTIVFTAANGDQLSGTVAGQFTSPGTVAGTYTFTGGTGRFKNAGGEADFFLSTPDGVHFSVDFEGNVSSAGANKK